MLYSVPVLIWILAGVCKSDGMPDSRLLNSVFSFLIFFSLIAPSGGELEGVFWYVHFLALLGTFYPFWPRVESRLRAYAPWSACRVLLLINSALCIILRLLFLRFIIFKVYYFRILC